MLKERHPRPQHCQLPVRHCLQVARGRVRTGDQRLPAHASVRWCCSCTFKLQLHGLHAGIIVVMIYIWLHYIKNLWKWWIHFMAWVISPYSESTQKFVGKNLEPSQLPRLATGRVAVTNGYSHRMFCWEQPWPLMMMTARLSIGSGASGHVTTAACPRQGTRVSRVSSRGMYQIASKVWIMMLMNSSWRQNYGLIGITILIGLPKIERTFSRTRLSRLVSYLLFKVTGSQVIRSYHWATTGMTLTALSTALTRGHVLKQLEFLHVFIRLSLGFLTKKIEQRVKQNVVLFSFLNSTGNAGPTGCTVFQCSI